MRKRRFTEEQIIGVLKSAEAGMAVQEVCRQNGIAETTYYRWKKKFGGMEVNEAKLLRQLEDENRCLKGIAADLTVGKQVLKWALGEKVVTPRARGEVATAFRERFDLSERRATKLALAHRSTVSDRSRRCEDPRIRRRLLDLAALRPRRGCDLLWLQLERESFR